ncbi:MAG: Lsr2 family protein [Acidimicrobiales bacterium]|nr:Lsr2 family protein [Acidimicrobiales bacterium]
MQEFVIARNPDGDSSLPYLIRLPLGSGPVVLKARDTWPRTAKIYCHPSDDWPDDPDIVERVPTRSCVRRGAAIDLVLDRGREHRSQFVFARARGRQVIFWQSARTAKQARPNVSLPTARAGGTAELEIVVDSHERYAWKFSHQQATTTRRALAAGDYAVEIDGSVIASVERKSMADLVSTIVGGKLWFLLADLAAVPRSALVVEDRYSAVFKLDRVRPAVIAGALGEAAARYPRVPIVFAETRALAQEWTYRFLGAARLEHLREMGADELAEALPPPQHDLPEREPTTAEVRAWAVAAGHPVSDRGRLRPEIWDAYRVAHRA